MRAVPIIWARRSSGDGDRADCSRRIRNGPTTKGGVRVDAVHGCSSPCRMLDVSPPAGLSFPLAYCAFARLQFRECDTLFVLYLSTLMVPLTQTVIPQFIRVDQGGWMPWR